MDFLNGKIRSIQQKLKRNSNNNKVREGNSQNVSNTGFESNEELKEIYLTTFDTSLRGILHQDLKGRGLLTEEDLDDYMFAGKIQELYVRENYLISSLETNLSSSLSSSSSLSGSSTRSSSLSGSRSRSSDLCPAELRPRSSRQWEKKRRQSLGNSAGSNALFTLEQVRWWDKERRQLIILDGAYISNAEVSICQYSQELWDYLISHNHLALVRQWIENYVSSDQYLDQIQELPEDLLLEEFISIETKDILLYFLVKIGYYPEFILNNFADFLCSLCKVEALFQSLHPMENFRKEMPHETRKSLCNKFDNNLLRFCQDNDLVMILWHYVSQYNISLLNVTAKDENKSWVSLLLSFRDVAASSGENLFARESSLFKAFCENSRLLVNKSMRFEEQYTVNKMLFNDQLIVALASFLICQNMFTDIVFQNNGYVYGTDKQLLEKCLKPYPLLHQAVTGGSEVNRLSSKVTMYKLLRNNSGLKISKFFSWQQSNEDTSLEDSRIMELPHFSCDKFMYREVCNFFRSHQFHLEHHRPVFAYLMYTSKKGLSKSLLMFKTYTYAMQHFTDLPVIGSCLLFLDLLNIDNEKIKVDAAVARMISRHSRQITLNGRTLTEVELQQYVVDACLFKKEPEKLIVLKLLEDATEFVIQKSNINMISYDAIWSWQLVMSFCRIHNLPYSVRFVEKCCEIGDWFHLFTFLHFYQVPSEQVIPTIKNCMINETFRGHVLTILQSITKEHNRNNTALSRSTSTANEETILQSITKEHNRNNTALSRSTLTANEETILQSTTKEHNRNSTALSRSISTANVKTIFQSATKEHNRNSTALSRSISTANVKTIFQSTTKEHNRNSTALSRSISTANEETILQSTTKEHNRNSTALSQSISTANEDDPPETREPTFSSVHDLPALPSDIIDVLLLCEEQLTPWEALLYVGLQTCDEVYAILAACYDDADLIACHCLWCICAVSGGDSSVMLQLCGTLFDHELESISQVPVNHTWKMFDFVTFFVTVLGYGIRYVDLILHGFRIFRKDDVNIYVVEFFHDFLCEREYAELLDKLMQYQRELEDSLSSDNVGHSEHFSLGIMELLFAQCPDIIHLHKLVSLLIEADYGHNFSSAIPNLVLMRKTVNLIYDSGVPYSLGGLFSVDTGLVTQHINAVFDLLLKQGSLDQASELARLHSLPQSKITLEKVNTDLREISKTEGWEQASVRNVFNDKIDRLFFEHKCNGEIAASFFQEQAFSEDYGYTNAEKSDLLMLAMQWYYKSGAIGSMEQKIRELEKEVWRFQIKAEVDLQKVGGTNTDLIAAIVDVGDEIEATSDSPAPSFQQTCHDIIMPQYNDDDVNDLMGGSCELFMDTDLSDQHLTPEEWFVFDTFIGKLLDKSFISEARRAASYFQRSTRDLEMVLAAISLAHGNESVDDLSENIKSILAATTNNHVTLNSLLGGNGKEVLKNPIVPSGGCMNEFIFVEEVENALEKLSLHVRYGKKPLQCIVVCFKTAKLLRIPYEAVVLNEVYVNLRQILDTGKDLKQELSKQFIKAFDLPPPEVDNFLGDTMVNWIELSCGIVDNVLSEDTNEPYSLSLYHSSEKILSLLELAEDRSKVGGIILQEVRDLKRSDVRQEDESHHQLACEVELLIYAHHAFSSCCDIPGIGLVLHFTRVCIDKLEKLNLYGTLARLIAGIGRFPEMGYAIEVMYKGQKMNILHQEIKDNHRLKKCLLDFLIEHHPDDQDTFLGVALHLELHREVAEYYEAAGIEAMDAMKYDIVNANLLNNNNKDFVVSLNTIKKIFKYAADYYLKDQCVSHAQKCMRMARLVEVQAQLPTGICVLGLSDESVNSFLRTHKNFLESYMVADSYELSAPSCFLEPLFHNVVLDGNRGYLEQYLRCFRLPASIVSQLASLYQKEKRTEFSKANMQHLLCNLHDLKTKLKLARDLGFSKMEKELVAGCAGAYLCDNML